MLTLPRKFFIGLLSLALLSSPALADPKSHVKERGHLTMSVALTETAEMPVGLSGTAEIDITKSNYRSAQKATLTLSTTGLAAGTYSVDVQIQNLPVHVGDFLVDASVPETPSVPAPIVLTIPSSIDAKDITAVSISNALGVVMTGAVTSTSVSWYYLANTPVTGSAPLTTSKHGGGKRVHGHAISQSFTTDGVETKRHFLFVAFGAPASTELTINVDGVAVGTVTSTAQGKVMFHEMPETVILRNVSLVTITDALGAVVMQAQF